MIKINKIEENQGSEQIISLQLITSSSELSNNFSTSLKAFFGPLANISTGI
jgi:hypothetical protein